MSGLSAIFKVLIALLAGPLVGGVLGGLLQSMGVINIGPADPGSIIFSIGGIVLVGILLNLVSG